MIWNYPFSCPYMWYTCAWKIIRGCSLLCFLFFATTLSDWPPKNSGHFVIQSEEKNQNQSRRARKIFPAIRFGKMSIVALSFDWFSALSVTSVIYFGFALTALNWQPFYGQFWLFIIVLKESVHLQTVNFVVLNLALTLEDCACNEKCVHRNLQGGVYWKKERLV